MGNMKIKIVALSLAAGIAFAPAAASAQVCGVGIIVAAMVANAQEHRELTAKEAATCGLMLGQDRQNVKAQKHAHTKYRHAHYRTKKKAQN
jgi:hypothetical protein